MQNNALNISVKIPMGPLGAIRVLVICSLCFSYALSLNVLHNVRN